MDRRLVAAVLVAGLASLVAGAATGSGAADGPEPAGISVSQPEGWHRIAPPLTSVTFPVDRLLLTSYPAAGGGNCGPDRAARELPSGGALVYLMEYRSPVGDPWRGVHRRDFPPRPEHFTLRRRALANYECWRVPSYLIRFRDADRPFQLHVALGPRATPARKAQVLRVLDSLRFEPLPPPPPDPFAGWGSVHEELGDSLRIPPGWSAGTTTSPRRYARPRSLLFASSHTLASLPRRATRTPRRLPPDIPAGELAADGVLLWVREERKGPASAAFPAPSGPGRPDFRAVEREPGLRWERAGVYANRNRFSLWIVSGPAASDADRELARKAAETFAFSTGRVRDRPCRRACLTG